MLPDPCQKKGVLAIVPQAVPNKSATKPLSPEKRKPTEQSSDGFVKSKNALTYPKPKRDESGATLFPITPLFRDYYFLITLPEAITLPEVFFTL